MSNLNDYNHPNSTLNILEKVGLCLKENLGKYILGGLLALVLLLLIYILLRRIIQSNKDKGKIRNNDKAVIIPLNTNVIPHTRCISNPDFADGSCTNNFSYMDSNSTNQGYSGPSHMGASFTPNRLPKYPSMSMVPVISRSAITHPRKIGEGYFGKVYKAQLQVTTDMRTEAVAIKMLKYPVSSEAEMDFMKEVEIMCSFKHPNILSLIGLCFCETMSVPWMIFEFMPHGDLVGVLRRINPQTGAMNSNLPCLLQEPLISIALHISKGMEYLARQKFVHRDLACRNCLVGENMVVKIADFGMSRDVHERDYYKVNKNKALPVRWMAPESIQYGTFTLASDVWSFGVVLWEVYNYGKRPYYGHCNEEVLQLILDGRLLNIPSNCPTVVAKIMRACWMKYIEDRITFSEICEQLSHLKDSMLYLNITPPSRSPTTTFNSARSAIRNGNREDDMGDYEQSDYLTPILRNESVSRIQNEFRKSKRFLIRTSRLFSGPSDSGLKRNEKFQGISFGRQIVRNGSMSTKF